MCSRSFALLLFLTFASFGQILAQDGVPSGDARSASQTDSSQPKTSLSQNAESAYRYWTTNWSFREIDLKVLAKRLKLVGVVLPVSVSGRADVDFDVSVPLNALGTGSAYRIRGTIQAKKLSADAATFESFGSRVAFDQGVLSLSDLAIVQGKGKLGGELRMQLTPPGSFDGKLKLANLDIAPIAKTLQNVGIGSQDRPVRGLLGGNVTVSGPVNQVADPSRWNVTGTLGVTELTVADSLSYSAQVTDFKLQEQTASWASFNVRTSDVPTFFLDASGQVALKPRGNYHIDLATNDLPFDDLVSTAFDSESDLVEGKLDLRGKLHGKFGDETASAELNLIAAIASPAMKIAGVELGLLEHDLIVRDQRVSLKPRGKRGSNTLPIEKLTAQYALSEQSFSLAEFNANLFGGQVTGQLSLARSEEGLHSLDATWTGLKPKFSLPNVSATLKNVRLAGRTTGQIKWQVAAGKVASPISHRLDANIQLEELTLGAQPLGELILDVNIMEDGLHADAQGAILGGEVTMKTVSRMTEQTQWREIPQSLLGGLRFQRISLARVTRRLYGKRTRFDGRISGSVRWQSQRGHPFETNSKIKIERLESGAVLVARDIQLDARTTGAQLTLRSIRGNYAGGQLEASGSWSFDGGKRLLTARIVRADGDRMLIPVSEDATEWVGGSVTATAQVSGTGQGPFDGLKMSGALKVNQATTFGLPVGKAHSPFRVNVSMSPLRWSADFPTVRSSLARGQVNGQLQFSSAGANRAGFNMNSRWRVNHVDFEQLLSTYVGSSTIGHGNVTGDLSLGGRNIRGARDLKGLFRMNLGGTDASAVPGLSTSGSLLGAASLAGVRFSEGEVSGRIARDSIVIDQLLMTSDRAAFQATGRIAISDQRLDIEATLATGNFEGQNLLLGQIGRLSFKDFLPLGQVNRLLSDRIVIFEMIGPPNAPLIRLLPARTLQANAKRFAVQEVAGLIAIDSLLMD